MNFEDILNDWERLSAKPGGLHRAADAEERLRAEDSRQRNSKQEGDPGKKPSAARDSLSSWLDTHGVENKDAPGADREGGGGDPKSAREAEARRLKAKKPEARIDLHGMREAEAEAALGAFLEESMRRGLEKVLVITGKGLHSQGEPILGRAARRVLEASPYAGRFGFSEAADGGAGSLWVLIRRKDHFSR